MKKEKIIFIFGCSILGIIMLFGVVLIWNSQTTIAMKVAEQEEAKKPAEIELTLISPLDCEKCIDGDALLEIIEKQDVRILKSETFLADSEQGMALIEKNQIERLPAVLVKGEYNKANVSNSLKQLGGEETDDTLVIQISQPVFFDIASNQAVGLVDVTYLSDSSCKDCYDPTNHQSILEGNFGITINTENTIDAQSTEGRALISKYSIKETPTVLISKGANSYAGLANAWSQVGSIEEDGTFIFRRNEALGSVIYKNLETREIIRPTNSNE